MLVVTIFAAPIVTTILELLFGAERWRGAGLGFGVHAAPCSTEGSATSVPGGVKQVVVTPATIQNMSVMFNCSDGAFEVYWQGRVDVLSTIFIGQGTTVKIVGDAIVDSSDGEYDRNSSNFDSPMEKLSSGLSLPEGLTSEAVGLRPPDIAARHVTSWYGPIFSVDGGQLSLENMIIRNGFVEKSTKNAVVGSGGGVHAISSIVNVTGCEFKDNFAELQGGGIFAQSSVLTVVDSIFRGCQAGLQPVADGEDTNGKGAGIAVRIINSS